MKRIYILIALVFLIMSAALVFLPAKENNRETPTDKINASLNLRYRYISTDDVAARIIRKDPALCLVDVRDPSAFNSNSLQGAVNIPLPKLTDPEIQTLLKQKGMDFIFYSDGDKAAENAWMICSHLNINNIYIMKGGLNHWSETILNPKEPMETDPSEVWALYDSRKAARQYFLGQSAIPETEKTSAPQKARTVKMVKSASSKSGEGC